MWLLIALLAGPAWTDDGVVGALKTAERAGFEQHDVDGLLKLQRPGATWIIGRTAVPDAHDIVLTPKAARARLKIMLAGPPGARRLEFLKTTVDLKASPPQVEMLMSRRTHGGRALSRARFELVRDAKGWGIVSRREWPLEERMGPLPTLLDDAFWLDADAVVDEPGTATLSERFNALLHARRYAQLMREAALLAARGVNGPKLYSLWAMAAFRAGDLEEARRLAKRSLSLGGSPQLPAQLLP